MALPPIPPVAFRQAQAEGHAISRRQQRLIGPVRQLEAQTRTNRRKRALIAQDQRRGTGVQIIGVDMIDKGLGAVAQHRAQISRHSGREIQIGSVKALEIPLRQLPPDAREELGIGAKTVARDGARGGHANPRALPLFAAAKPQLDIQVAAEHILEHDIGKARGP